MRFTGDTSLVRKFAAGLRRFPEAVATRIAARAAGALSDLARASYRANQTVYGDAREVGHDGKVLSLFRTGRLFSTVKFTHTGRRARAVLGTRYAKYNVKHGILPSGNRQIPLEWQDALRDIADDECRKMLV